MDRRRDARGAAEGTPDELLARLDWVRSLARALIADRHLAEDVAQSAAAAALERGPADARMLTAWLRGVVRRLAAMAFRERARRERRERIAAGREAQPAAIDVVERIALHRRVVDAVESLAEPYRTAILLRFYDRLAPREIAKRLGIPVATVKTRLTRGIELLRARLVGAVGEERRATEQALVALAWPGSTFTGASVAAGASGATVPSGAIVTGAVMTGATLMSLKSKLALAAAAIVLIPAAWYSVEELRRAGEHEDEREEGSGSSGAAPAAVVAAGERDAVAPSVEADRVAQPFEASQKSSTPGDPAAPEHGTAILRVRVVDELDRPRADALVTLSRSLAPELSALDASDFAFEPVVTDRAADSDGIVEFGVESGISYGIDARAEPGLHGVRLGCRGGGEVTLRLAPGASLRGRVVTTGGTPVPGAHVVTESLQGDMVVSVLVSDADGRIALDGIAAERLRATVWSSQGHGDEVALDLVRGGVTEHEFVVGEGGLLFGRITNAESGEPIEGARVIDDLTSGFAVVTDVHGEYRWPGFRRSGRHPIFVRAEGYGSSLKWIADLRKGEQRLDFELARGRIARGRIVEPAGHPIAGVRVRAVASSFLPGGQHLDFLSTLTMDDGSFELEALRKDLRHFLVLEHGDYATRVLALPPPEPSRSEIDCGEISLASPARIEGRVVGAEGLPAPHVRVRLRGLDSDWEMLLDRFEASESSQAVPVVKPERDDRQSLLESTRYYVAERGTTTDENGRFHFVRLPAGRFEVALGPDVGAEASAVLDLAPGEIRDDLELVHATGLELRGTAVDRDGKPIAETVFVKARSEAPGSRCFAFGVVQDGRFRIDGLEPGTYTLTTEFLDPASNPDARAFLPTTIRGVTAGGDGVRIELEEGIRLTGVVRDASGAPVLDWMVAAFLGDETIGIVSSSRDGRFVLLVPQDTAITLKVLRARPNAAGMRPPVGPDSAALVTLEDVFAEDGELEIELPADGG